MKQREREKYTKMVMHSNICAATSKVQENYMRHESLCTIVVALTKRFAHICKYIYINIFTKRVGERAVYSEVHWPCGHIEVCLSFRQAKLDDIARRGDSYLVFLLDRDLSVPSYIANTTRRRDAKCHKWVWTVLSTENLSQNEKKRCIINFV